MGRRSAYARYPGPEYGATMSALLEPLTLSALVAGALEYAILVRHRDEQRRESEHMALATSLGHQAMLRMRLLDRRPPRTWNAFGTRFR